MSEETPETPAPKKKVERVLWNTVAIIVARILADAFNVLVALKMARHLGDKQWGLYGYLLSSLEVFRTLTNFGLDIVAVRIMALDEHHPRTVTRHLMAIKTALCLLGVLAILATTLVLERFGTNRTLVMLLAASLFPIAYTASVTVRFQAEHAMDRLIPVQFVVGAVYLGAVYWVAAMGWRLGGLVSVYVAYTFLLFTLTGLMARRVWPPAGDRGAARLSFRLGREILIKGIPVGLLALIVVLYSRLSIFMLERYGGLEVVGHYFTAIKVSEPLLMIASALGTSAFPVLSRMAERGDHASLKGRFLLYSWRSCLLSAGVALVMTFLAGDILGLVKPEYRAASGALIALSWATVFMFQNQLSTYVINSFGKYHYVTVFAVVNLCVFLALSFILIPRYGSTGAGLSTFGTEGINTLVQLVAVTILIRRMRARDEEQRTRN